LKSRANAAQSKCGVLGLFPSFHTVGGVQASGRLAWEAMSQLDRGEQEANRGEVFARQLISYGAPATGETLSGRGAAYVVSSKPAAVSLALRRHWSARLVLVWHIGLLKLLPFFRLHQAHVALFLHGVEAWQPLDPLTRILLKRVDLFLTNSSFTWERFRTRHAIPSSAQQRTVHLGLGSALEHPLVRPADIPIALMVGRLNRTEDYKGHREMLASFPRIRQVLPNAELWIVGDGDLRPDLEAVAHQHEVASAVRFWGKVGDEEKNQLITRSRCLALPSRGEGFGLVYLEAMRLGRPCLVSTLDGGREVVIPPWAGLAANPADQTQLTDSLVRLLSVSPEWDAWSQNARQRYEDCFTARHFQDRLLAALQPIWDEPLPVAERSAG
jgi:phosphatidyl-myo-inositol dimannoside synthase